MSVDTNTTQGREHIDSPPLPKSVPLARVIAASLIAGAVSALVLVLVVFPGATESVITGSALLAFGFGWAMMRVLSARMTSHPQRWATIPAVAMTATGAGLLVFSPQDATLSTSQLGVASGDAGAGRLCSSRCAAPFPAVAAGC